jgi:hypothetical protein
VEADFPPLSPEEVAEAKSFFPMPKFFIFGHARSGTTLIARLMSVHPQVHCNWQAHFFTRSPLLSALVSDPDVIEWLTRRNNRWNRGKDLSPVVMRAASDFILEREARRLGKRVVGDKSPNNLLNGESVRLLHAIYPDAILIFIVRDGRDALISHRFQQFIDLTDQLSSEDKEIRSAFIKDFQPFLTGQRSIFTQKGLSHAARGWTRNVDETDQQAKDLFPNQYIKVKYEDLLQEPDKNLQKAWISLGVDPFLPDLDGQIMIEMDQNPDAEWQRQKESDIAANLRKGMAGSWREIFTDGDKEIFKEIAGDTLIVAGYEEDLDW